MRISDWSSDVCSSDLILRQCGESADIDKEHGDLVGLGAQGAKWGARGTLQLLDQLCRYESRKCRPELRFGDPPCEKASRPRRGGEEGERGSSHAGNQSRLIAAPIPDAVSGRRTCR